MTTQDNLFVSPYKTAPFRKSSRLTEELVEFMSDYNISVDDVCPVCMRQSLQSGKDYCSKDCQQAASRFRRRFDRMLRNLRAVGFSCVWQFGVHLTVLVPDSVKQFFVSEVHEIHVAPVGDNLGSVKPADLVTILECTLGKPVTRVINPISSIVLLNADNRKELVVDAIWKLFCQNETVFVCNVCRKRLFKSMSANMNDQSVCTDCLNPPIPF